MLICIKELYQFNCIRELCNDLYVYHLILLVKLYLHNYLQNNVYWYLENLYIHLVMFIYTVIIYSKWNYSYPELLRLYPNWRLKQKKQVYLIMNSMIVKSSEMNRVEVLSHQYMCRR